jgi:hypothetical protein
MCRLFLSGRANGTGNRSRESSVLFDCFVFIAANYEILITLLLVLDHSSETAETNRLPVS